MAGSYSRRKYGTGIDLKITQDLSGLESIMRAAKMAHTKHIKFGWLNGKKYPSSHKNKGLTIAQVAQWMEYGTNSNGKPLFQGGNGGMDARPSLSVSFIKLLNEAGPEIESYFKAVCNGKFDISPLNALAVKGKKLHTDTVMNQGFKPLSPITIRIKGHDFQLDDSGYLLQNFEARVYKTNFNKIKD